MQIIPRERWTDFSHEVIWHGRKVCVARGPKCADCGIEKLCHAGDKTWSTVEIHKARSFRVLFDASGRALPRRVQAEVLGCLPASYDST